MMQPLQIFFPYLHLLYSMRQIDVSSVGTEVLPSAFPRGHTLSHVYHNGCSEATGCRVLFPLVSAQLLRWWRWMLVTKCVPALAYRLYLSSLIIFPQVKLYGECQVCVVLGEVGPSCSCLHLLGSMPSSFGLDCGDGSFNVQREIEGGGSKDTGAFWSPLTVFGRDIKVGRSHRSIIAL